LTEAERRDSVIFERVTIAKWDTAISICAGIARNEGYFRRVKSFFSTAFVASERVSSISSRERDEHADAKIADRTGFIYRGKTGDKGKGKRKENKIKNRIESPIDSVKYVGSKRRACAAHEAGENRETFEAQEGGQSTADGAARVAVKQQSSVPRSQY